MADFRFDRRDVEFNLFEYLKIGDLCKLEKYSGYDEGTFKMVLGEAIKLAANEMWTLNTESDRVGAKCEAGKVSVPECQKKLYPQYVEGGWLSMSNSVEWGGQGFPELLSNAANEAFMNGCMAFCLTPMLTRGAAHIIETVGPQWMKDMYCAKMYSGEWAGTMCLTEPQAGSDLAAVNTKAKRDGDSFLIEGTKIFISSGDHDFVEQKVHPVLARIEGAPAGVKGISLFMIPKFLPNADGTLGEFNDVNAVNIEHKMGIKSSPTCTLNFGENGKCRGWLLGKENNGIVYMFQMMNEARLEVGLQSLALAGAAYMHALAYAQERVQGASLKGARDQGAKASTIISHPDIRRMLLSMKSQVEGIRALVYYTAKNIDLAHNHPDPEKKKYHDNLVQFLTPMVKAYSSDMGFRVTEDAIQVHGGYGFCQEYPVEQFCRDIKICSIYEGANGIQAMDLVARKMVIENGQLFKDSIGALSAIIAKHESNPVIGELAKKLGAARDTILKCTMTYVKCAKEKDMFYPLLTSIPFLRMVGDLVCGTLLLDQAALALEKLGTGNLEEARAKAQNDNDTRFYYDKVMSAKFFVNNHLPRVSAGAETILSNDRSALDACFPALV